MTTYIFYALIFVTVILLVEGVYLFVRNSVSSETAGNRRIRLIEKTGDNSAGLTLLKDRGRERETEGLLARLDAMLWASNLRMTPIQFIFLVVVVAVFAFLLLNIITPFPPFFVLVFASFIGFGLPYLFVSLKASKRRKLFSDQLVPSIDLVSRGLQAGHPAAVALEIVAKEMPDPIGTEFGIAIDQIAFGLDRNDALSNITQRFPNGDMRFFSSALEVQRETGGNLVEVLNNLTGVMRDRQAMRKKIKAMSAEGRFTAWVVGLLPIAVATIITLLSPDYYSAHFEKSSFWVIMTLPLFTYIVGMLWIRKMIQIRI